jgi:hypothetical protein
MIYGQAQAPTDEQLDPAQALAMIRAARENAEA